MEENPREVEMGEEGTGGHREGKVMGLRKRERERVEGKWGGEGRETTEGTMGRGAARGSH